MWKAFIELHILGGTLMELEITLFAKDNGLPRVHAIHFHVSSHFHDGN